MSQEPETQKSAWKVSVALAAGTLLLKTYGAEVGYLTIHGARDWERGYQLLHGMGAFLHGPEKSGGAVIPGFFYNLLVGLFQLGGRSIWPAAAGPAILFALSVFFVHDALRRWTRPTAALSATLLYATFPLGTLAMRYLWNPSYLFLFTALAFWGAARAVREKRPNLLAVSLMSALLATQMHMSAWFLVGGVAATAAFGRLWPSWKGLALVFAIHLAFVTPHYVYQGMNDWESVNNFQPTPPGEDPSSGLTLAPAPNLFWCLARQGVAQNPAWADTPELTFSYDERRLRMGPGALKGAAWAASVLSVPIALLALAGWVLAGLGDGDRKRRLLLAYALGVFVPGLLFYWMWAPDSGVGGRANLHLRYFFVFWPLQFAGAALALDKLQEWKQELRPLLLGWASLAAAAFAFYGLLFMHAAKGDGEPFQYLHYEGVGVFSLRDQAALAEYLVEEHGLTEDAMRTNLHAPATMFFTVEQSLTWPLRAAWDSAQDAPDFDESVSFYVTRSYWEPFVTGDFEELDRRVFGSLAVVAFRPGDDLPEGWTPDYPVDVYFDRN